MTAAYAISRPGGAVELATPYVPEFVLAIKSRIPYSYRTYDPQQKTWTIEPPYVADAVAVAHRWFDDIESLSPAPPAVNHVTAEDCVTRVRQAYMDHSQLHVLPDAPSAVIHAAYRALAREHHPDRIGASGHTEMVAINAAYSRLVRSSG